MRLLEEIEVGHYVDSGQQYDTWTANRIRELIARKGIVHHRVAAGDSLAGLGGAGASCCTPRRSSSPSMAALRTVSTTAPSPCAFNRFGHPAPEVLTRLIAWGAAVLRTDGCGAETLRIGADGSLQVERMVAATCPRRFATRRERRRHGPRCGGG